MIPGVFALVFDAILVYRLTQLKIHDCPEDLWTSLIVLPGVALGDSALYSILAVEFFVTDPETKKGLRALRTVVNWLRPPLGLATGGLKLRASELGYAYPGSSIE